LPPEAKTETAKTAAVRTIKKRCNMSKFLLNIVSVYRLKFALSEDIPRLYLTTDILTHTEPIG
jgi:hypothetical protein